VNPYESPTHCATETIPLTAVQADKICLTGMLTCAAIGCAWLAISFTCRETCEWAWNNHNLAFKTITAASMTWWMPLNLFVLKVLLTQKKSEQP
jgi:hypothetical protein